MKDDFPTGGELQGLPVPFLLARAGALLSFRAHGFCLSPAQGRPDRRSSALCAARKPRRNSSWTASERARQASDFWPGAAWQSGSLLTFWATWVRAMPAREIPDLIELQQKIQRSKLQIIGANRGMTMTRPFVKAGLSREKRASKPIPVVGYDPQPR